MKTYSLLALFMLVSLSSYTQTTIDTNKLGLNNTIVSNQEKELKIETNFKDTTHTSIADDEKVAIVIGGYLETFYSYNFNKPSNNINALRGFDFIANSLTIGNFVIAVDAKVKNFSTRLAINVGMTPSQFYKQEPTTHSSYQIPSLGSSTWQLIQEAVVNYDFEKIKGFSVQMGVMATPIGIEGLASYQTWDNSSRNHGIHKKDYRENWNFSRSNSFIHVPDYHSGIRALYNKNSKNTFSFYVINGQNMVTDNNVDKTIAISHLWTPNPRFYFSSLYMGGNERPTGSDEGRAWRHLFDFHSKYVISKKFAVMAQCIPGIETTRFGLNKFLINAIYLKYNFTEKSNLAVRYEHLFEEISDGSNSNFLQSFNSEGKAGLYGVTTTLSHTLLKDHLMIRLEHRYDFASENYFYKGQLQPSTSGYYPFLTNAKQQNTLSFSVVGWF